MPETISGPEVNGYQAETPEESETQANLDYFWHQIGDSETLTRLDFWDKRWMMDATLWVQLEPLETKLKSAKVQDIELDQFKTWVPKTKSEAYTATHRGGPRLSIRAVQALWQDAFEDERVIAKGSRAGRSDAKLIRENKTLLYTIADCLMARESLMNGEWPRKNGGEYKDRQKYWRGLMSAASQFAGDEPLLMLYEQIADEATSRLEYWSREFNIPIRLTGRIATGRVVEKPEEPKPAVSEPQPENDSPFQIPPDVQEELGQWLAAYAAEFDRLDHMGMPEAEKQRILKAVFCVGADG
jgi:hypothetical protein